MDYNDLMILAKQRKILQKDICEKLELTSAGFKRAWEKGSLSKNKLEMLCHVLEITPNELLGWPVVVTGGNVATNINGGHNEQNSDMAIAALCEQLKEKDKQIKQLIEVIESLKTGTESAQTVSKKRK